MEVSEILLLSGIFVFAGFVKGALGIGLPAFSIGLLTFYYEPRVGMALILPALFMTNLRQAYLGGRIWDVVLKHKYFCVFACAGIFVTAVIGARVPVDILMITVGIAMVVFAVTSLMDAIPPLRASWNKPVQILAGISSGVLGGLTSIWGPPLAMYLTSLRPTKDEMIQTLGVMFSIQCVFLIAGFIVSGELTARLAIIGLIAMFPAFVGMFIGERVRATMDLRQFMRAFLICFIVLGLNLIRRGVMGG